MFAYAGLCPRPSPARHIAAAATTRASCAAPIACSACTEKREKEDAIGREVWNAFVQFRTAVRQHEAAETLLTSASTSYDASLDAYRYGVKNVVDLVTTENQLAQARLAVVQARSAVRINAANLDYATGNLLRPQPPVAQPKTP